MNSQEIAFYQLWHSQSVKLRSRQLDWVSRFSKSVERTSIGNFFGVNNLKRSPVGPMVSEEQKLGKLALDLRAIVTDFVEHNLRKRPVPTKADFANPAPGIDLLKDRLARASAFLDQIIKENESANEKTPARSLQTSVDNYRVYLMRQQFNGDKPLNEISDLLYTSLAFKSELSDILQDLITRDDHSGVDLAGNQ